MSSNKFILSDLGLFDGANFAFSDPEMKDWLDFKALVLDCSDTPNEHGYYLVKCYVNGYVRWMGSKEKFEPGEVRPVRNYKYDGNERLSVR